MYNTCAHNSDDSIHICFGDMVVKALVKTSGVVGLSAVHVKF